MQTDTNRSHIQRGSKRANYDVARIHAILDAGLICQVAFVMAGEARVLPTAYARVDDALYFHGHLQNAMLQALCDGQTACVSVTLIDGLVLARSAFHHSMNYRSAVLYGQAQLVVGAEHRLGLDALMEHLTPGRLPTLRPYHPKELAATQVVRFDIREAAAKIRTGPPSDAAADYALPIWAGVLPLRLQAGPLQPCPQLAAETPLPAHLQQFVGA